MVADARPVRAVEHGCNHIRMITRCEAVADTGWRLTEPWPL